MNKNTKGIDAQQRPWLSWLGLGIVLLVMSVMLLREIGNTALGYPDADRLLMDGVFILDFLKDMPLTRLYEYTINYYAQYPALSIGYRPPFYPFIEAIFNGIFGVNMWSSRLAIVAFMLVGVTAWFKLITRIFNTPTAFWASLLLVTTPFIAKWGWYTMGELPLLSMAMLTGYVFYRYTETDKPAYMYSAAFLFSTTVWTKQTAIVLGIWFLFYVLSQNKLVAYLKRKEIWISIIMMAVLLAPLVAITLWLGDKNLAQSVGTGETAKSISRLGWSNLKIHLIKLYQYHITLPVLVLSIIGIVWAGIKRDGRAIYFCMLIVAVYVFFSYLVGKNERYPIFWIPAFTLFAALPLVYLRQQKAVTAVVMVVLAGVTVFNISETYKKPPNQASGYDVAARYVLEHSKTPTVFVDAYNNGYFTYFMRQFDQEKSMYVLRADKLLSSSAIGSKTWLKVHADTRKDIRKILDQYGIVYIVVESRDESGIKIHQIFRDYLKTGPFRLRKEIPVISKNRTPLKDQTLLVYEYMEPKPITADYLELNLPVVGQTIKVPMRK